jgi:hypothetical protein
MTIRIAIGYSLFAIAQAINRFFTTTSLQLPIKKIPH